MNSSLFIQQRGRKRRASESEPSSSYILTSTDTKRARSAGAYDPNFRQRMVDNRIYYSGYTYADGSKPPKPQNWDELQQMLTARRRSLSLYPEARYIEFQSVDDMVTSEDDVMSKVIQRIQGTVLDANFTGNIPFINLADMMQGESHKAKPDRFYGARPEQLHQDIRNKLQALVVPSAEQTRPIAPNFFIEVKPPKGSAFVALNQACFAGAVGARGIQSLQTYGEQTPAYDNKAFTLSATYHSGTLKIYSHHVDPAWWSQYAARVLYESVVRMGFDCEQRDSYPRDHSLSERRKLDGSSEKRYCWLRKRHCK